MNKIRYIKYDSNVMNMKKIDKKQLAISIIVPLLLGGIVGFLIKDATKSYDGFIPSYVFPIVWSILYILMGIASYLVRDYKELANIYKINLFVNYLWPIIFFLLNLKFLALLELIYLIVIVIYMISKFYKKNKTAAYLLMPYILWLFVAFFLNLSQVI